MLYSTYLIPLGVLLLLKSSTSAEHSRNHDKFYSSIESKPLSSQETDNLRLVLNFIRQSPEFHPLTFSVILPEFQSSFIEFLLSYIGQNSIEAYKVRARDLSLKATWMSRLRLTWIFVVQDLSSFNIFVYWQWNLWKAGNQYLIIFTGKVVTTLWTEAFTNLWRKYDVHRIVVVDDDFRCLTRYMPLEKRSNNDFGRVYKSCLKNRLNRDTRLFENFQNLNHYPLNVLVFESLLMNVSYDTRNRLELSKPDANVAFALEKAMRATFRIKAMRKVDFMDDPFATSLTDIETRNVDMVITGFFVKVYSKFRKFQFTCAMYEDKLCFVSPDSGLVPKAYMPFLPFQKSLWFLLIAYNITVTFLWWLAKHISESLRRQYKCANPSRRLEINRSTRKPQARYLSKSGIKNYFLIKEHRSSDVSNYKEPPEIPRYIKRPIIFIEHLTYPFQTSEIPAQRALLLGTLFFALILNGLYQSVLVSSLSKPFHYPQLHNLEDVVDSGKIVITKYANLKNVFLDDSELDAMLVQRIRVINTQRSTKDIVAYEDKIAITRYYTLELGDSDYFDKEGNPLLNLVDECPMNYRVSYVSRLHSPYAEKVDFVLLRLREAGLLNFWFDDMLYRIKIAKIKKRRLNEDMAAMKSWMSGRIRLSLDHYLLTFLLLFVGLFGSTVMFFVELYIAKRSRRKC
ncbi:uncharacterized protein LOC117154984 [Bombus vancouverensis nearcticus]|uniref:uncharacterized protein LOC117154984 n=1 Tax=Bombus vancouverensis nearcticus TaxID=2705178 RepID=UPI00402B5A4C